MPQNEGLWQFAVTLYGQPGIQEACLELQDRHGAAVTVILYIAWLHARGVAAPSAAVWAENWARLEAWRSVATERLRSARRAMKPLVELMPGAEIVRETVKAAELAAERAELEGLEGLPGDGPTLADGAVALEFALATLPEPRDPGARILLERILARARVLQGRA